MSNNFNLNSGEAQNNRAKIVMDAMGKLKFAKQPKHTAEEALMLKVQQLTVALREHVKPIVKAGGAKDKPALRALIITLYLEGMNKFSKDELITLSAWLHSDIMMETIENDPNLSGSPDLLSGI